MDPRQGEYTYYTIQHQTTHRTDHNDPDGELKPVENDWGLSCFDWIGHIAQPWGGKGNDWKPLDKKASGQIHSVWSMTGSKGWWDLDYAMKALHRLMKANEGDEFMSKDSYRRAYRNSRHNFRIVKITWAKKIEVVSLADATMILNK